MHVKIQKYLALAKESSCYGFLSDVCSRSDFLLAFRASEPSNERSAHVVAAILGMAYRPYVDGLRAVAILLVVAFHVNPAFASGGFIGVDVFFVISGFLITSIIIDGIQENQFSLIDFYKRRSLRIIPLLIVVVAVTVAVGYVVFLPNEFKDLSQAAISAALFYSNIFFWRHSGYFETPASLSPLLHTWSLAVEEQFYIFFPIFLVLAHRLFRGRVGRPLFIIVLISFAWSVIGALNQPFATFYLLPTRAWELGVGALVAVGYFPTAMSQRGKEVLAFTGVCLMMAAAFLLTDRSTFPGYNALYPVLGAALVIAYGQGTAVGRVLSWSPIVFVGLVSYGWYLWHWPVIVFARYFMQPPLGMAYVLLTLAGSFLLAVLSRRIFERPIQLRFRFAPPAPIVATGLASLVLVACLGWTGLQVGQIGRHFPPDVLEVAQYTAYRARPEFKYQFRVGTCMLNAASRTKIDEAECLTLDKLEPDFLIIGDSHAAQLWRGLSLEFKDLNFLQATASGCRPLLNTNGASRCTSLVDYMYRTFLNTHKLDGVILAGRWQSNDVPLIDETVEFLRTKVRWVIVLGPVPEYKGLLPALLARSRYYQDQSIVTAALDRSRSKIESQVETVATEAGATYISLLDIICPKGVCKSLVGNGVPIQFDYGHLTLAGSLYVAKSIEEKMILSGKLPLSGEHQGRVE